MCLDEPQKRLITGTYGSNFLFIVARALGALMAVDEVVEGMVTCGARERFLVAFTCQQI
jgi:hypothetical protein